MSIPQLRNILPGALLVLAALIMLPACSSTEEAPPPASGEPPPEEGVDCVRGDQGICCDLDPMQGGCAEQL